MHWILLAAIACIIFLISYNPRTGNLTKFFAPEKTVEDNASRTTQSYSDTHESSE